jgi:hypothetical protein
MQLPPLDELHLDENVGVQWSQSTNDLACFAVCSGPFQGLCSVTSPGGPTDWNCDGSIDSNVQQDINLDGQLSTALQGVDDWARVTETFQCLPTYNDGPAPPEFYPPDEDRTVNLKLALDEHRVNPPVQAAIDIRPGCDGNAIALASSDTVQVAIYSSATLDATKIDPTTLSLQGEVASMTSLRDLNGDGVSDMLAEFPMSGLHLVASSTFARLDGALPATSQQVFGSDSVVMVPRIVLGRGGCPLYRPPTASCRDITGSADASCHLVANIDAGSSDADALSISVTQTPPSPIAGAGVHDVTLTVDNGVFTATCSATVTVIDVTPPQLTVTVSPSVLWPPDHRLVPITPAFISTDNCDPNPVVSLIGVSSSEPTDPGDIVITNNNVALVAAERAGYNPGRTYTLSYRATDASGNSTDRAATVNVPHNL